MRFMQNVRFYRARTRRHAFPLRYRRTAVLYRDENLLVARANTRSRNRGHAVHNNPRRVKYFDRAPAVLGHRRARLLEYLREADLRQSDDIPHAGYGVECCGPTEYTGVRQCRRRRQCLKPFL